MFSSSGIFGGNRPERRQLRTYLRYIQCLRDEIIEPPINIAESTLPCHSRLLHHYGPSISTCPQLQDSLISLYHHRRIWNPAFYAFSVFFFFSSGLCTTCSVPMLFSFAWSFSYPFSKLPPLPLCLNHLSNIHDHFEGHQQQGPQGGFHISTPNHVSGYFHWVEWGGGEWASSAFISASFYFSGKALPLSGPNLGPFEGWPNASVPTFALLRRLPPRLSD